jgi:vanillate/3-O-methylgallate O-demethylase
LAGSHARSPPSSLGGSFSAPDISDYYFTPWELGYGNVVKFDHDYIGRDALERSAGNDHRRKVSLVWNPADVARIVEGYVRPTELPPLYLEFPRATYASWLYDTVHDGAGQPLGISTYPTLLWTERSFVSLGILDAAAANPGTEVTLVWGEPDGGARSAAWIEPHRQMEVRATVAPAPIGKR